MSHQYMCEECGTKFNRQGELDKHKRTTHKQYRCGVCGESFDTESQLQTHRSVAHSERQVTPIR
jgi:DNA-directed RNA polymerase subunit RPC12/RpoP